MKRKYQLQQLVQIGIHEGLPDYLAQKVAITNQVGFLLGVISIPFVLISYFAFGNLALIPFFGVVAGAASIVFNSLNRYDLARIVIGLGIPLLAMFFHACIAPADSAGISSLYMIQFGMATFPIVLFDLRELRYLIPLMVVTSGAILLFPYVNGQFDFGYDYSPFETGMVSVFAFSTSLFFSIAGIFTLSYSSKKSSETVGKLINEMSQRQSEIEANKSELEQNFADLEKSQLEEAKRQWESKGHAQFSNLLRNAADRKILLDKAIAFIVEYAEASLGGIYVLEEKEGRSILRLDATFAYDRKKYIDREFEVNEGLVGQCYQEEQFIYQNKIPENYINIKSGLGDIPPKSLILVPLKSGQTTLGIMELALLRELEANEIHFLCSLGENLATAIGIIESNLRTQTLLSDAQEQSEMLRAQEEEMRQNMEELSATQEEMHRREVEQDKLIREIKGTNDVMLMFQDVLMGTIESTNTKNSIQVLLNLICVHLQWSVACAYQFDEKDNILKPYELWSTPNDETIAPFVEATKISYFKPGVGLPGRVLSLKKPSWIIDVTQDENFPRLESAKAGQVKAAFGFPILIRGKVNFVLEFFTREAIEPDNTMLSVFDHVGFLMGTIFVRNERAIEAVQTEKDLNKKMKGLQDQIELLKGRLGADDTLS